MPPELREDAAIKQFLTVPDMGWGPEVVKQMGGVWHAKPWVGEGFTACNAADPEGNVLQVRVIASAG